MSMWNIFKRKPKPEPLPRGRVGLLSVEAEGGGLLNRGVQYNYQLEVEITEDFGDLARIKIVDVHGSNVEAFNSMLRKSVENAIVNKSDIRWLDKVESQ